MFVSKRKRKAAQTTLTRLGPRAAYPESSRLPGAVQLQAMERIAQVALASGAPDSAVMAQRATLLGRLVCAPHAVEVTTNLVVSLGEGRQWLEANCLEPQAREYAAVLGHLADCWDQSGALRWYRDSLK